MAGDLDGAELRQDEGEGSEGEPGAISGVGADQETEVGDAAAAAGDGANGDLDGLLQFAQQYDGQGDGGLSSERSHDSVRGSHKTFSSSKPKGSKFAGKPKSRSNNNKDKSGRRHQGVKHKIRVSKSDY